MIFNYLKICSELLEDLPGRTKDVLSRRFGLEAGQRETLQAIGESYGITRERVRQIETDGILRLGPRLKKHQKIFQYFNQSLKEFGNLKKEEPLLSQLGGQKFNPHVFFLLNLSDKFERFSENQNLHSLWTIENHSLKTAQQVIEDFYNKLLTSNQPLGLKEYNPPFSLNPQALFSYLEVSKLIEQGPEGKFGLREWPEINPRGVKDKAYLVFKKEKRPLHFTEVANLISPQALVSTVHNELIRDPRFVLVGRGLYALEEWGYQPGTVKDVITRILKETGKPLSRENILEEARKKRIVKENTILLNLSNNKYFSRNSRGKYFLKK